MKHHSVLAHADDYIIVKSEDGERVEYWLFTPMDDCISFSDLGRCLEHVKNRKQQAEGKR